MIAAGFAAELKELRRQDAARQAAEESRSWGGRAPTAALLAIGGRTRQLAFDDRDVADALADLPPPQQRAIAVRAAGRACELAGIAGQDWVLAGLSAVAEDRPLPAPWQDWESAWARLHPGRTTTRVVAASIMFGGDEPTASRPRLDPGAIAIDAVRLAADADPAAAAMGAVHALGCSGDTRTRFAEVRTWLSD